MKSAGAAVLLAFLVGDVDAARADGAFPNVQSVLLPSDRPREIVLGTTFGLVFSEDEGATWQYACESASTVNGRQYVLGAPPEDRIYGVSDLGIAVSIDGACTWVLGGGALGGRAALDVFPDPSDPEVAFALALGLQEGLVSAYRSDDGGLVYHGPLFTSPPDGQITGIEMAASDPRALYLTIAGAQPVLALSGDGGETWTTRNIDLGLSGDARFVPSLAAVDPTEAARVYLRITSVPGDSHTFEGLAVTPDGGMTWKVPLLLPNGSLAGLVRMDDGSLFVVGTATAPDSGALPQPVAFRSDDGGQTFSALSLPIHAVGLGQRNGTLFAPTNTAADGFALATSVDRGTSWQPRLRFSEIGGVKGCVQGSCQPGCEMLAAANLFPQPTCRPPVDAGAADARPPPSSSGDGCSCGLTRASAAGRAPADSTLAVLALAWMAAARAPRRMRGA